MSVNSSVSLDRIVKLEANPSSRTRIFDFNQINLYCLTSYGEPVWPLKENQ
jgi:hypothetical protein